METLSYMLIQDRLSSGGSFILCDNQAQGFPIRYASRGFCDLFGYEPEECKGKKCGDLVATRAIFAADPDCQRLGQDTGMSPEEAKRAVFFLQEQAAAECRAMMADPDNRAGVALVPNIRKSGEFVVIELVMMVHNLKGDHTSPAWSFSTGLQRDIARQVSMAQLLRAALDGSYATLLEQRGPARRAGLDRLDVKGEPTQAYLNEKALEVWQSFVTEVMVNMGCGKTVSLSDAASTDLGWSRSGTDESTNDGLSTTTCRDRQALSVSGHTNGDTIVSSAGDAPAPNILEDLDGDVANQIAEQASDCEELDEEDFDDSVGGNKLVLAALGVAGVAAAAILLVRARRVQ